jgi:ubiquinone/menaquinone biosynthesis C-methylase UbiE
MENLIDGGGWYFRAREKFLARRLKGVPLCRVLDVGCGKGVVARVLRRCEVTGIDSEPGYPGAIRAQAEQIPFNDCSFDAVTCFDVLEHVQEHGKAVMEIYRVLCPGGKAYLSVPLYPRLWSRHDEALGHVRRYRPGEVKSLLEMARFKVLDTRRFMGLILPVVAAVRLVKPQSQQVSMVWCCSGLEKMLGVVCNLELCFNGRLPIGLTEFIVAEKAVG